MSEFVEETTIHGIAEFYRLKGAMRVCWLLAFCGSLAFFAIGSASLVQGYIRHESATKIGIETERIPPFAIIKSVDDLVDYHKYDDQQARKLGKPGSELAWIWGSEENRSSVRFRLDPFAESSNVFLACNSKFFYRDLNDTERERAIDKQVAAHGGLTKLAAALSRGPHLEPLFDIIARGCDFKILTQASSTGIKNIMNVKGIRCTELFLLMHGPCSRHYYVSAGTSVFKLDDPRLFVKKLECTNIRYTISITTKRFSREKQYCSQRETNSEFSCVADCWIKRVRRNSSACITYVGDSNRTKGLKICLDRADGFYR